SSPSSPSSLHSPSPAERLSPLPQAPRPLSPPASAAPARSLQGPGLPATVAAQQMECRGIPAVVAVPLDWKSSSASLHTSNPTAVLLACILKLSGTAVAPLCAALPWSARRRAPPLLRPSPARAFPCPGRPVACSPPATRVQPLQGGELRAAVDWQPSTPPLGRPTPARARPSSARPARAAPWQLPQQLRRRRRRGRRLHRAAPIHAIAQPRSGASQFRRASSRSAAGKDGKGRRGREVVQCREEGRRGRDDEWDPRVSEKSN
ncbi:unnamed protein product, partial [Urochloa humidicola]